MTKTIYRRITGVIVGMMIGLSYGLVSQWVNLFLLPGLSFYQPPVGPLGNLIAIVSLGTFLGILSAWTEASAPGVLLPAGIAAIIGLTANTLSPQSGLTWLPASLVINLFLLFPATGFIVPIFVLVRMAINRLTDYRNQPIFQFTRLWIPIILVLASGGLGLLQRFPEPAQVALRHMEKMLQAGINATSESDIPGPLLSGDVDNFIENRSPTYQLAYENNQLQRFGIPRPASPEWEMAVVIARFDNGWNLVCLYPNPDHEPRCKGFEHLP